MINLMLQNRQPVIYGDGEQTRSFSDVNDCIFCIDKLATDKKLHLKSSTLDQMKIIFQ